jgi:acyl carrier protein
MKDQVVGLILACLHDVRAVLKQTDADASGNTALFGPASSLDSMSLLTLVVAVEESVNREFGASITLSDERALMQDENPFRTVNTLASYICTLMEAGKA